MKLAYMMLQWLLVAGIVGLFSQWPTHAPLPDGHGELKLSMAHLTDRIEPCRELSPDEIQALSPNMRVTERCERGRVPAKLELKVDETVLFEGVVLPAGLLHRDGRAYLQQSWLLPAGRHEIRLHLRDTARTEGFDHSYAFTLELSEHESALLEIGDGDVFLRARGSMDHDG